MKVQYKNKLQKMVMVAVFAAVMAVLSQISIPLPTGVPVTLQTFAVALCGYVLGPGCCGFAGVCWIQWRRGLLFRCDWRVFVGIFLDEPAVRAGVPPRPEMAGVAAGSGWVAGV